MIKDTLDAIEKDIKDTSNELEAINEIEQDFIEFAIDFVENLRTKFWELNAEDIAICKQLLFPDGFSVSRDKKVYTPHN
ncbi:MAG TPA: hypothetical protein PKD19_02455 [Candidatus Saccharibacteria bacterium]|jgi:3-dehydroquinate dehydratase|nr:hypothetical protein [Candidatus Saccharibacteria bacterium]HMR38444.1 hypothetical protein [Candidatus Saccharibacteria bacterium]